MSDRSRQRYAAYGSNLHPLRIRERIASASLVGTAFLQRYSLFFHKRGRDRSAKCGISVCGRGLHVAVYDISADDRRILDRVEGAGRGYDVREIEVPEFGSCFTYLASGSHIDDSLQPFDWYREIVLLGCRWHGFPGAYCERIAATPAMIDTDPARRCENWRIVERLRNGSADGVGK